MPLPTDDKLIGVVTDRVAEERASPSLADNHAQFIEVVDTLALGTLSPSAREEVESTADTEAFIAVAADHVIANHLIREAGGNHGCVANDEAANASEVEIPIVHFRCRQIDLMRSLEVRIGDGCSLPDCRAELPHPTEG